MGDAFTQVPLETIITDKYNRAYNFDLGNGLRSANARQLLQGAVDARSRRVSGSGGPVAFAFSIGDDGELLSPLRLAAGDAEQARVLAGRIALRLSPDTDLAFGFAESAEGLVAQLQGQQRPAFMIAQDAAGDTGFQQSTDASLALRRQIGPWGFTVAAQDGEAWLGAARNSAVLPIGGRERREVSSLTLAADRNFGDLQAALGLTLMDESDTVLGAYFSDSIGNGGARTLFVDANAAYPLTGQWRMGGALRYGTTEARQAGRIGAGSRFDSMAWSFDVTRSGVFQRADSMGLRVSQPLRVEGGGLLLDLPIAYDYASESAVFGERFLSLSPEGRELMGELSWHGEMLGGDATTSLFVRRQPGHVAAAADDAGVVLRWNRQF